MVRFHQAVKVWLSTETLVMKNSKVRPESRINIKRHAYSCYYSCLLNENCIHLPENAGNNKDQDWVLKEHQPTAGFQQNIRPHRFSNICQKLLLLIIQ